MEEEFHGRPSFSWTNKYGQHAAGRIWSKANAHCASKNLTAKQEALNAGLTYNEVLACVLYTGDAFTPLNSWLRKLGPAVEEGRQTEISILRGREETWASTALHVASAMMKLVQGNGVFSPLTRGIEGMLPADFFVPDERGMVTLTEYGFMSTSRAASVADSFTHGGVCVVMEVIPKAEDAFGYHNGVDLEWLTMCAGELETLFPPGTLFDVVSRRRRGMRTTLEVRPTFLF
eukprot:NODE_13493_length_1162_cov_3.903382.p1 GENE.NODE_13493_length_1162_cov_3.903382~~NODE_13493_length_1162_cov_3.903382.p1  ORF type:complete len:257 (-),score=62.16 NODE_13493_length_1162_cov_3.903382:390-1085(-)